MVNSGAVIKFYVIKKRPRAAIRGKIVGAMVQIAMFAPTTHLFLRPEGRFFMRYVTI